MFTWEEAGLLRSMLLVLKWTALVLLAAAAGLAVVVLAGCPPRITGGRRESGADTSPLPVRANEPGPSALAYNAGCSVCR